MTGELIFIGLGLHDEKDITLRGLEAAKSAGRIFAEFYTSVLADGAVLRLEALIGKNIEILGREDVEAEKAIVAAAKDSRVAFLTAGDPMAATTHVSLRLRAAEQGIKTSIIHSASVVSAAAGALGLQHYKFGRIISLTFPQPHYSPTSAFDMLALNRTSGLHTLVLLDLAPQEKRFMSANEGIRLLYEMEKKAGRGVFTPGTLACVAARLGAPDQIAASGKARELEAVDFGPAPHCIIVPGKLHFMEEDALRKLSGLK